ncbi:NmrA family NAD(P)-binding protein [Pontibacter sp. HSC-36F09]|uniref:NmrA family NAD(P)-binding protein n=1 Tax=Pontibacter sp. HSC-36F09 TaxID=2910966 RepID=UPI00209CF60A|nr:NmrA family NAD(P)-binding protein [Pontibacter sp. HSC-36F09]MCP2043328.1 nucleoside-diphosphate-sugar epimerase [Pontibacter sp. HSC-36F09]
MESTNSPDSKSSTIVVAGATGDLGGRIARSLLEKGANVRVLVRRDSDAAKVNALRSSGAIIFEVDYHNNADLTKACEGATCVVSALSGLHYVMVGIQSLLLNAAVAAGVPRFIPSDFAIDFTKLPYGNNRNLDLRKEFRGRLDKTPIAATSIHNGMFADLLTGQAPIVLFPLKRVMYYGNADQLLDFTTIQNTADFTAAAALDPTTPRDLRIAGDVLSARGLKDAATEATGEKFSLFRVGGLGLFNTIIKVTKALTPGSQEVFPAWQGMQYMRDMFSGLPKLEPLDKDRYPEVKWTSVAEVLAMLKGD